MRESILRDKWQQLRQLMARYRCRRELHPKGFTILELLVVTVIIGTLSTMAAPPLQRAREMAQVSRAIAEIGIISSELAIYFEINFTLPASLAGIERASLLDPWGLPYMYVPLTGPGSWGLPGRTSSRCRSTPTSTWAAPDRTVRVNLRSPQRTARTTSSGPGTEVLSASPRISNTINMDEADRMRFELEHFRTKLGLANRQAVPSGAPSFRRQRCRSSPIYTSGHRFSLRAPN